MACLPVDSSINFQYGQLIRRRSRSSRTATPARLGAFCCDVLKSRCPASPSHAPAPPPTALLILQFLFLFTQVSVALAMRTPASACPAARRLWCVWAATPTVSTRLIWKFVCHAHSESTRLLISVTVFDFSWRWTGSGLGLSLGLGHAGQRSAGAAHASHEAAARQWPGSGHVR